MNTPHSKLTPSVVLGRLFYVAAARMVFEQHSIAETLCSGAKSVHIPSVACSGVAVVCCLDILLLFRSAIGRTLRCSLIAGNRRIAGGAGTPHNSSDMAIRILWDTRAWPGSARSVRVPQNINLSYGFLPAYPY